MNFSISLTTPAFLFSTLSLLMSAYTARFSGISNLIRKLHEKIISENKSREDFENQVKILKKRLSYIKYLQFFAILSLFFSTFAMFAILIDIMTMGVFNFALALLFFLISLVFSILEIQCSVRAINWQIET